MKKDYLPREMEREKPRKFNIRIRLEKGATNIKIPQNIPKAVNTLRVLFRVMVIRISSQRSISIILIIILLLMLQLVLS